HCDHGITLFEDRPKGQAHCGHGGEAPNLEVVYIRSVIDVSQRIAFIMANRDLTGCFGGHRALFLISFLAIVWAGVSGPDYYTIPLRLSHCAQVHALQAILGMWGGTV